MFFWCPIAAFGLLMPMVAAGAMAFSSIFVVTNSLRLRGYKVQKVSPPKPLWRQLAELTPHLVLPASALGLLIAMSVGWVQLTGRQIYGLETRDTLTYRAMLDTNETFQAGVPSPLDIKIVDQFGNSFSNFEMSYSGTFLNFGYIAVAARDLSFMQSSSLLIDPYLAYGRAAAGSDGSGGGGMGMGGASTVPTPSSSSDAVVAPLTFQERAIKPKITFPKEGQYTVFVQFWPRNEDMVILTIPIKVGSAQLPRAELAEATPLTQSIGDLRVTLTSDLPLKAGEYQYIQFDMVDGQGVAQTGAVSMLSGDYCKLYILDQDLKTFLRPDFVQHANLKFSVKFPKPGKYKAWFEFVYGSRLQQLEYNLDVQ